MKKTDIFYNDGEYDYSYNRDTERVYTLSEKGIVVDIHVSYYAQGAHGLDSYGDKFKPSLVFTKEDIKDRIADAKRIWKALIKSSWMKEKDWKKYDFNRALIKNGQMMEDK